MASKTTSIIVALLAIFATVWKLTSVDPFISPPGKYDFYTDAQDVMKGRDLTGKTYLVTGATNGLGKDLVRELAAKGATVIATGRTMEKAKAAVAGFGPGKIIPMECEQKNVKSIQRFIQEASKYKYDVIFANAGIIPGSGGSNKFPILHGVEEGFFINHVATFMIVNGLLPALKPSGRVVVSASSSSTRGVVDLSNLDCSKGCDHTQYDVTKTANLLFVQSLARRFEGTKQIALAVHPGCIWTNLFHEFSPGFQKFIYLFNYVMEGWKTPSQGVATLLHAGLGEDIPSPRTTHFLWDFREHVGNPLATKELADSLWSATEALVTKIQ